MNDERSRDRTFRLLWYSLLVVPFVTIGLAIESASAKSADEALGEAFCMGPIFIGLLILAIVAFVRTLSSPAPPREKRIVRLLCASVIPLYFLASATSWQIGWPQRGSSTSATLGMLALNVVWLVLVSYAGTRIRHSARR